MYQRSHWLYLIVATLTIPAFTTPAVSRAQDASKGSVDVRLPITFQGDQRTEVFARVSGYVAGVKVDIGSSVTQGQVLIILDAPELDAEVTRREQQVAQAEAMLRVAESGVETAKSKSAQAQSELAEQKALVNFRQVQIDRFKQLVDSGVVDQGKLDEVQYQLMAVKASRARIEANVAAAAAAIQASLSDVEYARSGIEVAKAELAHAVTQSDLRTIRAPFAGLITARNVDAGAMVSSTKQNTPMLVIENIEVLRGVMTIPAEQASQVAIGNGVEILGMGTDDLKAPDGGPLAVTRISQALHMTTRTMRVEIDVSNPFDESAGRYSLFSGQYGTAIIRTAGAND